MFGEEEWIVFVIGDAKTSFRMRQYFRYLNYEENVNIIEKLQ